MLMVLSYISASSGIRRVPAYVLASMGLAADHIRSYSLGELIGAPPPFGRPSQVSPNLSWLSWEVPIERTSSNP